MLRFSLSLGLVLFLPWSAWALPPWQADRDRLQNLISQQALHQQALLEQTAAHLDRLLSHQLYWIMGLAIVLALGGYQAKVILVDRGLARLLASRKAEVDRQIERLQQDSQSGLARLNQLLDQQQQALAFNEGQHQRMDQEAAQMMRRLEELHQQTQQAQQELEAGLSRLQGLVARQQRALAENEAFHQKVAQASGMVGDG